MASITHNANGVSVKQKETFRASVKGRALTSRIILLIRRHFDHFADVFPLGEYSNSAAVPLYIFSATAGLRTWL